MRYQHSVPSWLLHGLAVWSLSIVLLTAAHAQSPVAGKWEGTTRNGMQVILNLKVADQALTGTVTREGQPATITDGKVSGNTITFKAVLGGEPEALSGELDGEQLKVWLDRQGREGTVAFTRAKE